MGIFEKLHDQASPLAIALALKDFAGRYHGAVGLAWLGHIVRNRQQLSNHISKDIQQFVEGFTSTREFRTDSKGGKAICSSSVRRRIHSKPMWINWMD